jgi:hypothetical protein
MAIYRLTLARMVSSANGPPGCETTQTDESAEYTKN